MLRFLSTIIAAAFFATGASSQDTGAGIAESAADPSDPAWVASADAMAREIVTQKLFISDALIEAFAARARVAAAKGDLEPVRFLAAYYLSISTEEEARRWVDVYRTEATRLGDVRAQGLARLYEAYYPAFRGDYAAVERGLKPGVDQAADALVIAGGSQLLAYALTDSGRPAEALKYVQRGLNALAEGERRPALSAALHDAWRYALINLRDFENAVAQGQLIVDAAVDAGFPVDGLDALYNLANVSSLAGLHAPAKRYAGMVRFGAELTGSDADLFWADLICARVMFNAGDYAASADCAARGEANASAPHEYLPNILQVRARALARLGRSAEARAVLARIERDYGVFSAPQFQLDLEGLRAEIRFAEGDAQGAFVAMRDHLAAREKEMAARFNAGVKELRASLESELDAAEERIAAKTREAALIKRRADLQRVLLALIGMVVAAACVTLVFMRNYAKTLAAARAAAESANRSKSEFLASMSHELRTPLNGVLGMAQILHTSVRDPAEREQVKTILDSGRTLTAILNDILDLSKIEAGKLDISPVDDDLPHALRRLVNLFEPQAREKGLTLALEVDENAPRWMRFDPVRVRQCVANLISNGVKFTDRGDVRITIGAVETAAGFDVTVAVRDTGVGMDEATLAKLFTPFTQADATVTRRFGGTGLGLTITRRLARMMDGDVVAASAPGVGTTMTLTFRAEKPSEAPRERPQDDSAERRGAGAVLRGKTVLIVDDIVVNRQVAALFLAPFGARIMHASSGAEAIDLIQRERIDAVLMDIQMPAMDGYEATRRIRALGGVAGAAPIVALTAEAMEGDREKCLAAGMDDYAPKPLEARTLLAALSRAMTKPRTFAA